MVNPVSRREHHSLPEEKPLFHRNDVRMSIYHFHIDHICKIWGINKVHYGLCENGELCIKLSKQSIERRGIHRPLHFS